MSCDCQVKNADRGAPCKVCGDVPEPEPSASDRSANELSRIQNLLKMVRRPVILIPGATPRERSDP